MLKCAVCSVFFASYEKGLASFSDGAITHRGGCEVSHKKTGARFVESVRLEAGKKTGQTRILRASMATG